jgi:hypothetical protein
VSIGTTDPPAGIRGGWFELFAAPSPVSPPVAAAEPHVPGLFVTSMPAVRDLGPHFAFTVAVRASARLIGAAL